MKKFKYKSKQDRIKISDSDRAEVWKYLKKHEEEIRKDQTTKTMAIMLTIFAEWYANKHEKMTEEELDRFAGYCTRIVKYNEEGYLSVKEALEIFKRHTDIELNLDKKR